ncbi:MAG: xanthine dehydrogenase family protein subunit M [Rhizobiales bacterium]|nr:xanthine dehydrogenase family protein subunit M [Hyphomicrobiales bacterium]MBN8985875.1 xanthine dehydrogenase family protein subunit M [Hyphomicrobiales bacterium]
MLGFELSEPATLDEAFDLLADGDPGVRPMGGGTALMLMMKAQIFKPERLVSLRNVGGCFDGLRIDADQSHIRIGGMTTFAEIERSPMVLQHLPAVVRTMKTLANIRVRHVASVGGNLAHADPHLDLPPVWMAHAASIRIVSKSGERVIPVEDLFAGYYETTLGDGELIGEVIVPVRPEWTSTYVKVTTRSAHDWPALGIAVSANLQGQRVNDLRLVLSAALDRPTRLDAAENELRGSDLSEAALKRAGEAAVAEADIHSDSRGSAAYKQHLLRVHLSRAMHSLAGA